MFSSSAKEIQKKVGARTQPCLTPLRISNGSEELPLNCTVILSVHFVLISVERLDQLSSINSSLGETCMVSADQTWSLLTKSKALVRSMKEIY